MMQLCDVVGQRFILGFIGDAQLDNRCAPVNALKPVFH